MLPCSAPAMFTTNKQLLCCKEALNHGSEFKILCDTFRSQIAKVWFPYNRTIAIDRRRSQKIEHGSIFCDRLWSRSQDRRRSQKCVSIWSQTIAELFVICNLQSAIICDHMETSLKSGTGTWGLGDWDIGLRIWDTRTRGRGAWGHRDVGTWVLGDVGTRELWGCGTRRRQDSGMCRDSRAWDVGTWVRDKQTTPDFCAEFVK